MKRIIIILTTLMLILAGCSQSSGSKNDTDQSAQTNNTNRKYTLEMYNKIDVGKTYEEVKAILGDGGSVSVDTSKIKQYIWTNEDKSTMSVLFTDNAVTGKSQANLPATLSGNKAVTKKMYDKINNGMTLKQVTDILGEGTPRVMTLKDGKKEILMGWDNSDGSNITITLLDGVVTDKDDLMLK